MADIDSVKNNLAKIGVRLQSAHSTPAHTCLTFYGPEGSGKSTLAASAAAVEALQPVVALDFEGSMSVAEGLYDPDVFQIVQLREWQEIYPTLNFFSKAENHPFKTVIVDPVNALQGMMQTRMVQLQDMRRKMDAGLFRPDPQLARLLNSVSAAERTNNSLGHASLTEADYGTIGSVMLEVLESLALAPYLTIFTAHTAVVKSKTGAQEVGPYMKGNESRVTLGRLPSAIGYIEMVTSKETSKPPVPGIRFDQHRNDRGQVVRAKSRFRHLKPMLNPTMETIWEAINRTDKQK